MLAMMVDRRAKGFKVSPRAPFVATMLGIRAAGSRVHVGQLLPCPEHAQPLDASTDVIKLVAIIPDVTEIDHQGVCTVDLLNVAEAAGGLILFCDMSA
ncbi:hypothetical protein [Tardiphaga sp. vice278]|uniref:hypothetical protein n=1 Tax=Tardiphaga sp. vice278 TaxID=2592815 RepID=UPI001FEFD4BF|nr:hypothetical protein [Tardiphaga sp. vice278]